MAGFPCGIGMYNLHRSKYVPPATLQEMIFTDILRDMESIMDSGIFIYSLVIYLDANAGSKITNKAFISLIKWFRIVILQGVCLLYNTFLTTV